MATEICKGINFNSLVSAKKWDNTYNYNIIKCLYDNVNKGACHLLASRVS